MKKMIKMMAAVAVFAMAVLVTPESMGAGVHRKAANNDCSLFAGITFTKTFEFDQVLTSDYEVLLIHCDLDVTMELNADCSVTVKSISISCYPIN
jgi:hypothetical protein